MKQITLSFIFFFAIAFTNAQGLQGVVVEKYYAANAADSIDAASNGAITPLRKGAVTYRVFMDLAPGYKFLQIFGNSFQGNPVHPLLIKTSTNFYNDPSYGQIFPQGTSLNNTKKNTTLIDSWLSVGGVCVGKMGVLKTEDTDGSIGNSTGILTNNPGGTFGVAINSVVAGAQDGLLPGSPLVPTAVGIVNETDVFDQTAGGTFSCNSCAIAGLGGVTGVTPSNMVLIGQFTTDGVLCYSLNVQIQNTVTNTAEIYVHSNAQPGETFFPALVYCSPATNTTTPGGGDTSTVGLKVNEIDLYSVKIYPNPSHGVFTISSSEQLNNKSVSYAVYDITGQQIYATNPVNVSGIYSQKLDISRLPNGLYFVSITIDGKVSNKKLVKE